MCGNRVEELEARVKELEASVEGLTDELVECKVRLREMENAVDTDSGLSESSAEPASDSSGESESGADRPIAQADKSHDNREESEADSESDSGSDIIVA